MVVHVHTSHIAELILCFAGILIASQTVQFISTKPMLTKAAAEVWQLSSLTAS